MELVLKEIEKDTPPGRRDPEQYFITIFGEPSDAKSWGWRFEGHHLAFNFTVVDGNHVFFAPSFIGSNPAEAHPISMLHFLHAKELGAKMIVIDPRFTRTASVSDYYAPIRPGSDIAFLGGVLGIQTAEERYQGYLAAMHAVGAPVRDDLVRRDGARSAAARGNDAERAAMIAAVLHGEKGARAFGRCARLVRLLVGDRGRPCGERADRDERRHGEHRQQEPRCQAPEGIEGTNRRSVCTVHGDLPSRPV